MVVSVVVADDVTDVVADVVSVVVTDDVSEDVTVVVAEDVNVVVTDDVIVVVGVVSWHVANVPSRYESIASLTVAREAQVGSMMKPPRAHWNVPACSSRV